MTLVVPNTGESIMLKSIFGQSGGVLFPLILKLYSNNKIPAATDTPASYTEVSGGGYASVNLPTTGWTVTPGTPSVIVRDDFTNFDFTGVTAAPATIYGYYIIDSNSVLLLAERFPDASIPFIPQDGSQIALKARLTLKSELND